MSPKSGRKSPMRTAVQNAALTRSVAQALVERAERQTGSRMAAYETVGQTVGASAEWIRKFIKGDEAKAPDWIIGWNLLDYYNQIGDRVETEITKELQKHQALREEIDAVNSKIDQAMARTTSN